MRGLDEYVLSDMRKGVQVHCHMPVQSMPVTVELSADVLRAGAISSCQRLSRARRSQLHGRRKSCKL